MCGDSYAVIPILECSGWDNVLISIEKGKKGRSGGTDWVIEHVAPPTRVKPCG